MDLSNKPIGQLASVTPLTNEQRFSNWKSLYDCFANWKDSSIEVKKGCLNLGQVN